MILRRRFAFASTIPMVTTIIGIFAVGLFGTGITLDNYSLTVLGIVFLVFTLLLVLVICIMECRRKCNKTVIDPPMTKEDGLKRNKSDTDLELMTGNAKEDVNRMYEDV